ncbi:2-hydroxychromene-2-carboxylate isomerase [Yoonia sp. 208BN28-4]|uniref:2-hydroxychromene-2-carboxylate isomerase n=1 Tax=Yoonia sp. 208BN28-4 TaxID=3126505 RepID=UPI0030AAC6A1
MAHIDYYFATLSPYTYLCGTRPSEIAAAHGATLTYKPLDIMALFGRTGGTPPGERHPNRQAYRLQDMRRRAAILDLPINVKPAHWPTNGAPASYAIIAAQAEGGDVAKLVSAISTACWSGEKNIADDAVIRDCLKETGFDPDLADKGMLSSAETFASNLEDAVNAGVFGAPFFVVDSGEVFWGEDRLADLDAHLSGKI